MVPRLVKPERGGGSVPAVAAPPIHFGAIALVSDGVQFNGEPAFGDYDSAMGFVAYVEEKSPWWKAALFDYADKRPEWAALIDAVIDAERFTRSTVSQYKYVHRAVPEADRVDGLSFSHHEAVAPLPSADKRHYLKQAKREHLSVSALKQIIRREKPVRRILKGQASALAKAHDAVTSAAYEAAAACREIPQHDAKDAEKKIKEARRHLETCEAAVARLRKVAGGTK